MKLRVPSYYKEFTCIASACEDTCCSGWDVVIDSQTYKCYQAMEGTFGEKLRSKMVVDQEGDNIFVLDGERCPFLNNNNLCDIYKEKGEAFLSYTCKQYPRYMETFGDIKEMGISLSCPEAARIILRQAKASKLELSEGHRAGQIVHEEQGMLIEFFLFRACLMDILARDDISLGLRGAMVLRFVEDVQDKIDFLEMDDISQVREKYKQESYIKELIKDLNTYKGSEAAKYKDVHEYFKTYQGLEHIMNKDPLGINKILRSFWKNEEDKELYINKHHAFNHDYKDNMFQFELILRYFIYRYFMKSFYDYHMSSKIKLALISTIMIKELAVFTWIEKGTFSQEDMVEVAYRYSRDIEHLEENVEALERIFETEEVYKVDKLIHTLINEF